MQVATGAIIAGKYQLETPLARGGMGSVWIARHVKLGSRLAVKFLDPRFASSPAFIERFEREARAAAALQSPNVVHVQDYGVEDDTPYLVMELLQGEDLGQRLSRLGRLSLPETARILVQVGKALRRAHEGGIVHRDLKPANLFLTRIDDDEVVKVLDFGIAKEVASVGEATKTGEVMGSPHYMSPEQARADKGVDHRADVWALGVIVFRAVTGTLPFPGDVLGAVLSRILVDPVPPVTSVAPDLPPSLDAFFAKTMAKAKEHRFQSVRELVDAFVQIAGVPMSTSGPAALAASSPGIQGAIGSSSSSPGVGNTGPRISGSWPGALGASSPGGAPATGPVATQVLGGTGPSTLTAANLAGSAGHGTRRSAAPWIAVGAVVLLLGGGGAFGWSRLQSTAAPETGSGAPSSSPPAASTPEPATPTTPNGEPTSTAAPTAEPALPTPPAPPASTAAPGRPPAPTTAPSVKPPPTTPTSPGLKPTSAPPKPTSKPTAKPSGGWGF